MPTTDTPRLTPTVLEVVVPVYNEEATLPACVERLVAHLRTTFPYPFRVTVADNASTDSTWEQARRLRAAYPEVDAVHLAEKGRGRALKQTWLASDALVLAYVDVDLSTDLDALYPLVAPLLSGHSDLAIGSRLAYGARVVRGGQREVVSRSYNVLLRAGLGARFSDAQCGFKAVRADVAHELLPHVHDTAWFFDTELLVVAQRCGLRVHEVPVDWVDDPDSRVDVVRTALDDLAGMVRLRRALADGQIPVADIAARIGRGRLSRDLGRQVGRFAVTGLASTGLHLGLFALFGTLGVGLQLANVVALLVATVVNTALNRRWTFGDRDRSRALAHQGRGLAVFAGTCAAGAAALWALHVAVPEAGTATSTLVLGLANAGATIAKFGLFRSTMTPAGGPGYFVAEPNTAQDTHASLDARRAEHRSEATADTSPAHLQLAG